MDIYVTIGLWLLIAVFMWWRSIPKNLPPGPWGLPFVGYLFFLTSKPYATFTKLAKRYGSVFSVRLGSRKVIVINDFETTKEAFLQDAFIGRPEEIPFAVNNESIETGALFGLPWKEQRRHTLHMLRDVGFGKSKMEEHIQNEISELLEHLEENVGQPFSIRELLIPSTSNNIASLVFGKRFKYDDPVFQMLIRSMNLSNKEAGMVGWLLFFPTLKKVFKFLGIGTREKQMKICAEMRNYFNYEISEHEKTLDPNDVRDFIDGYLLEIKKKNDPTFSKPVLQDLLQAFFNAGSDTVRQSVEWLLLMSASDQKAQQRIQAEIEDVVRGRHPTWADLKSMPYTEAFIMETMRWRTIVPINLLRFTLTDCELNGYFIPKHMFILSNHWEIHHDPKYWGSDADEFRPERFLNKEQNEVKKWEHFIPFSIGKRACPGEPLARVEVFLYFTSILQRFNVALPAGKVADFDGELGIALEMKPHDFILSLRKQ